MAKYLGEKTFKQEDTPFVQYTPSDWAMYFIESYGQTDGGHHKQWVLDQVARILNGSPIKIKQAAWDDGEKEWRVEVGTPSNSYKNWVKNMKRGGTNIDGSSLPIDEQEEYGYDEGIAP